MKKIALFASHNGSIFETIYNNQNKVGTIELIITNNTNANIINKAKKHNIPYDIVNSKRYDNIEEQILSLLKQYKCDLIVLAGYMKKITPELTNNYTIINSHPALLPKFGGHGMYGKFVHEAVIAHKEKESGVTIHYVNENYDEGAIILQKRVQLSENENVDSLEAKIKELEKEAYLEALKLV
jgi:phosphoribosylglycinamide formyltransferase-1